jgi:membrane associated rhomboid family serine protease
MIVPLRDNAPHYNIPFATIYLILINAFIYLFQLGSLGGPVGTIATWGIVPARIWGGELVPGTGLPAWVTLLTASFLHFGFGHLLGNMVILWLFGDALEWLCGRFGFVVLYFACALVASLATALLGGASTEAGAGASGAVAGIMGAYVLMYPRAKVTSLWLVLPGNFMVLFTQSYGFVLRNISALWFIGSWILFQVIGAGLALQMDEQGPFGVYAHVAGAACGMGLIWLVRIPSRMPAPDHPCRSGRLTAPIVGDAGDGGRGVKHTDVEPWVELEEWKHTVRGRAHQQALAASAAFDDRLAMEMLERGDLAGARAYCEQMLELAQQAGNSSRVAGFQALLAEIQRRAAAS